MLKTPQRRTTFGGSDVEKVHAVVAGSTFRSQNVKNTRGSDHFWKLRCRKSARRCGGKHISKSMLKTPGVRTTFGGSDVKKVHAVVAGSTFPSQNVKNTRVSDHSWRFRCRKSACRCGAKHISKSKCTKHTRSGPLLAVDVALHYTYTPLHYNYNYTTTLHYTPVHSTTLNYSTPHYITLHYAPLHYTTLYHITLLHYTTPHYTTLHYTTLSSTTLHYLTLHYTPLRCNNHNYTTTLHYTKLHYTTLHYTTLHSATLHYTTLHYTTLHYTE